MTLWAIVPVKPLAEGKSRLSSVLAADDRLLLNRLMLLNTLTVLSTLPEIDNVVIVSRDPAVAAIATLSNVYWTNEENAGLNAALRRATSIARGSGASRVLILPADLPLLNREAVQFFLQHATIPPEVLIAPDRWGKGTNALYLSPAGILDYCFGEDSFLRHTAQAVERGIRVHQVGSPILGKDLDTPVDFFAIRDVNGSTSLLSKFNPQTVKTEAR